MSYLSDLLTKTEETPADNIGRKTYVDGNYQIEMVPVQQRTRFMTPHYRTLFYIKVVDGWRKVSRTTFETRLRMRGN